MSEDRLERFENRPRHSFSQEFINNKYHVYKERFLDRARLRKCTDRGSARIVRALSGLKHLKKLHVHNNCTLKAWRQNEKYCAGFHDEEGSHYRDGNEVLQVFSLLWGIERENIKLETLVIREIHWSFLHDREHLRIMSRAIRYLKLLDLCIHEEVTESDEYDDLVMTTYSEDEADDCHKVINERDNRLNKFLKAAVDLRKLSLEFDIGVFNPDSKLSCIAQNMIWHTLESLKIVNIENSQDDLVSFLVRHAKILVQIHFIDIRLTPGCWISTFEQMQSKLRLQVVCLGGYLTSDGSGFGQNKDWDFTDNAYEVTRLRDAMQDFFINGTRSFSIRGDHH